MNGSVVTTRPRIVADFEYSRFEWLVVEWPDTENDEAHFEVYRADLPWHWLTQPYEDVRGRSPSGKERP